MRVRDLAPIRSAGSVRFSTQSESWTDVLNAPDQQLSCYISSQERSLDLDFSEWTDLEIGSGVAKIWLVPHVGTPVSVQATGKQNVPIPALAANSTLIYDVEGERAFYES